MALGLIRTGALAQTTLKEAVVPGNVMGEAEKEPIVIKTYKFTPVD